MLESTKPPPVRRAVACVLWLGVVVAGWGGGCARGPRPDIAVGDPDSIRRATPEVPVVLVPGITGSKLRHRKSKEVVWGEGVDLFLPRDGGYNTALPIGRAARGGGEPRLEAFGILEALRLGPVRREVYGPLIADLEARGWRRGRLEAPFDPRASLYTFAYDWRRSAVRAAGELADALEQLGRARGEDDLRVDLICQSSGGYVCRWLAKYGGASLDEAEEGRAGHRGARFRVRRILLVGAANGGALRILRELDRGRRYVAPFGRRMRPEVLFTFPSLYEDLPHEPDGLFLDAAGEPLPADEVALYDPGTWRRYGWSAFGARAARRIAQSDRDDLFGTEAERRAHLERSLRSARRFQALLAEDPRGFGEGMRYFLVGNAYAETPRRAVVVPGERGWRTLFAGSRELARWPYVEARATGPGDGHAAVASMHHLSPAEHKALGAEPFYVHGGHFEMILKPAVHRRVAEFLLH